MHSSIYLESSILLDDNSLATLSKILYVLSKKDNFILFVLAKDGLKSTSTTPTRLGLSKKKYYTRLNQLLTAGLISEDRLSNNNTYVHTTLGKLVFYNHIIPLMQELKNAKGLLMLDILKDTNRFTNADIEAFMSPIFEKLNLSSPLERPPSVRILLSDIEPAILSYITRSQTEIFVATRTYIKSIMKNVALKAVSGIKVRLLADVDLDAYLGDKIEHVLVHDHDLHKEIDAMKRLHVQENMSIRRAKVPMEILLVDDKSLIMGLIDRRNIDKFNAAIIIEDNNISKLLKTHFMGLWEASEQSTKMNIITSEGAYHSDPFSSNRTDGNQSNYRNEAKHTPAKNFNGELSG